MSWFNRIRSTASRAASNVLSRVRRLASSVVPESIQRRVTHFGNRLTGPVGSDQTPQVLKKIVEHVRANYPPRPSFKVGESDSGLREFMRVYTINGIEGYDARRFLRDARKNIRNVLWNNRQTKVKIVLQCNMERQTNCGRVIRLVAFHSDIEVNFDGTDEEELYNTTVERMLEKMATFQSMGSWWRLQNVIRLELHTL